MCAGTYTVEASWVMAILLGILLSGMLLGFGMFSNALTAVQPVPLPEADASAKAFRIWETLRGITAGTPR